MATSKKTWRGRALYAQLLEQRAAEGLSFSELSTRSGVPIGTLQRWCRQFRREAEAAPAPFVELVAGPPASGGAQVGIVLRSGRTLTIPAGHPFDGLSELVVLLERC
ncbi:MAG: hypothetical protein GY946_34255 [bacterium]|nr:hypothetical protein [bacterium]